VRIENVDFANRCDRHHAILGPRERARGFKSLSRGPQQTHADACTRSSRTGGLPRRDLTPFRRPTRVRGSRFRSSLSRRQSGSPRPAPARSSRSPVFVEGAMMPDPWSSSGATAFAALPDPEALVAHGAL
jgi:hypothetical protein